MTVTPASADCESSTFFSLKLEGRRFMDEDGMVAMLTRRSVLLSLSLAACNIVGDTRAFHLLHVLCADLKSKARVWIR